MNFNKDKYYEPFYHVDTLKELKELRNQIKKALNTKDVTLIDSLTPLNFLDCHNQNIIIVNFTSINFEKKLSNFLNMSIEKKELALKTLLDKTTVKLIY